MADAPTLPNEAETRAGFVIPAKAGIQLRAFAASRESRSSSAMRVDGLVYFTRSREAAKKREVNSWIPAFAGMTSCVG
jgi:hypothetical protein